MPLTAERSSAAEDGRFAPSPFRRTPSMVPGSAVEKAAEITCPKETELGDRRNMVYAGTTAVYGRGTGVVIATGARLRRVLLQSRPGISVHVEPRVSPGPE